MLNVLVAIVVVMCAFLQACESTSEPTFVLQGKLEGIENGKIVLTNTANRQIPPDTALIVNGEFTFTGNIAEPTRMNLMIAGIDPLERGRNAAILFYAENASMFLSGHADSLGTAVITGGAVNEDEKVYSQGMNRIREQYRRDTRNMTREQRAEMQAAMVVMNEEIARLRETFIRENPNSYYSVILIEGGSYGRSAEDIEKELAMLDPDMSRYPKVVDLYLLVDNLKNTDMILDEFVNQADDLNYGLDTSFKGSNHKEMVYLSITKDDQIVALRNDGLIRIVDTNGNHVREFKTNLKSKPNAVAVNRDNEMIYVLGTINEVRSSEVRGRVHQVTTPVGVECLVFDKQGRLQKSLNLERLVTVTGAKVEFGKLFVADTRTKIISIFNAESGELESSITNGLRSCCGILDFSITPNQEILVANLGAFRVQAFDLKGEFKYAFGRRGTGVNDFQGCCNPVNVAYASNGGILTIEKDPTRIKLYSKDGARQITGIDELVHGCSFIPAIIDSKDNLFLASPHAGIVKCVPGKSGTARDTRIASTREAAPNRETREATNTRTDVRR